MISIENKFRSFIKRYSCGYNRLAREGHVIDAKRFGMQVKGDYFTMPAPRQDYVHPLSYELVGLNIRKCFSVHPTHRVSDYNTTSHILHILERKFSMKRNILRSAFMQGCSPIENGYTNVYSTGAVHLIEDNYAFETGRFLMSKFWDKRYTFNRHLEIFSNL